MHRLKLKTAVRLLDHLMAQGFFVPSTDAEEYKRGDISSEAGDFGSKRGDPLTRDCTDINAVIIDFGELLKSPNYVGKTRILNLLKRNCKKLGSIDRDGILWNCLSRDLYMHLSTEGGRKFPGSWRILAELNKVEVVRNVSR